MSPVHARQHVVLFLLKHSCLVEAQQLASAPLLLKRLSPCMDAQDDQEFDLYGFQLKGLDVQQQAIRLQCDGNSRRNESNWVAVAQQQQLPPEAKLKSMVRQVSKRFGKHTLQHET